MHKLAEEQAASTDRDLKFAERRNISTNEDHLSDDNERFYPTN